MNKKFDKDLKYGQREKTELYLFLIKTKPKWKSKQKETGGLKLITLQ